MEIPVHQKLQTLMMFPEPVRLISGEQITQGQIKPGLLQFQQAEDGSETCIGEASFRSARPHENSHGGQGVRLEIHAFTATGYSHSFSEWAGGQV